MRKVAAVDHPNGFQHLGLASRHLAAAPMQHSHRHSEVELNYVYAGEMTYLFGSGEVYVAGGRLVLFWAALPHKIVRVAPDTTFTWLTIPLTVFLGWRLPQPLDRLVLEGKTIVDTAPHDERASAAQHAHDRYLFEQWQADLRGGAAAQEIMLLEVEARLRRLALTLGGLRALRGDDAGVATVGERDGLHKADQMARFIMEHHSEPLRVAEIAAAASLHPNYAMTLFRARHGISMIDYLTQHRIAHAQRLLVTSEATVLSIALEVGFNSLSRFYTAFDKVCGRSPGAFRAALARRENG